MPLSFTSDSPSHSCGGFLADADAPRSTQETSTKNFSGAEIRFMAHLGQTSAPACFELPLTRVGPRSYRLRALYVRSPMSRRIAAAYKCPQAAAVRLFGGC